MEEGEEPQDRGQKNTRSKRMDKRRMPISGETIYKGYCNVRIHELAQPRRWFLLYTYKNFRQYFEHEKAQAIKEKVQEMFGMTPEEAELYFNQMRQKKPRKTDIRFLKQRISRERKEAKVQALCIFHGVLKKAMRYSYKHSPPLLVTPMLRLISDHMLEVLAHLHGVEIPKRCNCDNISTFLISIADWCALFVSNIYYELEVETRKEEKLRLEQGAIPCSDTTLTSEHTPKNEEKKVNVTDYDEDGDDETELLQQQEEL